MGRRLGQHFLTDTGILDRIVDALDPRPDDVVIEVGPGKGSLTWRLAPRVQSVIAIEKDEQLARELAATEGLDASPASAVPPFRRSAVPPKVHVVPSDALTLSWHDLLPSNSPFKVVGNIPYYITSPLIDKALTSPRPRVAVFLIQREVADRLVAEPGGKTYGAISVGVRSVATVDRLFTVKPGSFRPPPRVDSAVVRLQPLEQPLVGDNQVAGFRAFVTGLFAQRRKQLRRSLRSVAGLETGEAVALLEALGVDPTARPEALAPGDIAQLFHSLPG